MGRNAGMDWLPNYRQVLVATAVRSVRDSLPAVQAFAAERRAWLTASAEKGGWRSVAVAAGAVPDHAVLR